MSGCNSRLSQLIAAGAMLIAASPVFAAETPKQVTFAKDVAPIFQAKCQSCHQPNSIAPMSLITYQDVRPWARSIRDRVSTRQMPPCHIDPSVGVQKFKNDMSLTQEQIEMVVAWVDAGAPAGDPKDMPAPRPLDTDNDWRAVKDGFGPPDLVIKSAEYTMPAQHQDMWWRPMSDIPVTEPRWVRMVEIRPTNMKARRIVHHAIAYHVLSPENTAEVNTGIGAFGGGQDVDDLVNHRPQLMEWAIGKGYDEYMNGTGKLILPGSKISWDVHYASTDEDVTDTVELGIYFYPKGQEPKFRQVLHLMGATNGTGVSPLGTALDLPPNTVKATEGYFLLKENGRVESFQPHMHLRGKAMTMEAILPNGQTQVLSHVADFNFNWHNSYV